MYTQEEITKAFGPYQAPETMSNEFIAQSIAAIESFPSALSDFYSKLGNNHDEACYREGGWNFRQVIHHIADSHSQAFTRFKLTLTEENPVIKPYIQNAWADSADSLNADAFLSIQMIPLLHARWVILLKSMKAEDFEKAYIHPEYKKTYPLADALGLYAWHGKHHLTQMQRYASNQGWI